MIRKLIASLRSNQAGSAVVEFALIGPLFLTMFFGVMQVGIGMQSYNALRSISADTARYAVVNYQRSNLLTPIQLQTYARNLAKAPPYGLEPSPRFTVFVSIPATQRIAGATEFQIRVTYRVRTWLGLVGVGEVPLTYTRPIFLINN
jgi:TadE-like protein